MKKTILMISFGFFIFSNIFAQSDSTYNRDYSIVYKHLKISEMFFDEAKNLFAIGKDINNRVFYISCYTDSDKKKRGLENFFIGQTYGFLLKLGLRVLGGRVLAGTEIKNDEKKVKYKYFSEITSVTCLNCIGSYTWKCQPCDSLFSIK